MTTLPTRLISEHGVELWRLAGDGTEMYAVRTDARRARMTSSLVEARALLDRHVAQARLVRAH